MSETNNNFQEKPLDERRKNALLRYIGILFGVAFLFVLLSLASELKSNQADLAALSQSSTSALQKAEQLQDTNRALEEENKDLSKQLKELTQQLSDAQLALEVQKEKNELQQTQHEDSLTEFGENLQKTVDAYELLLAAGDDRSLLPQVEENLQYLGENALKYYENLSKEGE